MKFPTHPPSALIPRPQGFIASLISVEAHFSHTLSKCGPRATAAAKTPPNSPFLVKKSTPSTSSGTKLSKSGVSIVDSNKRYSKEELRAFYNKCIVPDRKLDKTNKEEDIDSKVTTLANICTGVKAVTECVVAGQFAAMQASEIFSLNFKESFYGPRSIST